MKLRIGLIGAGNICQSAHIPSYLKCDNVELVGVCDMKLERAQEVCDKYNMKFATASIDELVARDDIDAVSICVWNNAHAEAVIKAAENGKHVLCEKPMSMSIEECIAMKKAVEANGVVFMMGFVSRFIGEVVAMKEQIDAGNIGDICYARSSYLRRRGTPLGWFTDKSKSGGGPVIDIAVHFLDLTWYLMGKPKPVSVSATTYSPHGNFDIKGIKRWTALDTDSDVFDTEDFANGYIRFDNGTSINFEVSWALDCAPEDEGMKINIYGSKGGADVFNSMIYGQSEGYLTDTKIGKAEFNGFYEEISHFVDCALNGTPTISPIEDGIVVQSILNGIYESAEKGCEVKINLPI